MSTRTAPLRKIGAYLTAAAIGIVCTAPPCAAGESPAPAAPAPSPSLTALSTASQALLARADQGTGSTTGSSPRFFKTSKGAAVLALFGAGFGVALYSKVHDRVQSPVR